MEILVGVETVLLVVVGILLAGVLRSHAELLRRLDSGEARPAGPVLAEGLPHPPPESVADAVDLMGTTLAGDAVKIAVAGAPGATLLAFLSSGCLGCGPFWEALGEDPSLDVPGGARLVVVTKDTAFESPSKLLELAPDGVPLVMSSDAWERYRVAGSPYFVLVDGPSGRIRGEGTATNWPQVASLLRDAIADAELRRSGGAAASAADPAARLARADGELAAAGIGPGHPSLYAGAETDEG
ncbi:MAG: TlpA family protein disulfide reductase [Actinomycetota bacterium]